MPDALDLLLGELDRLNATKAIVSTNVEVRLDGIPYANRKPPMDCGAAVYFELKGKAIACDKWDRVEDNIYAIGSHIESIRAQERWGVGRIEQAFAGYLALMDLRPWWDVLGCEEDDARELIEANWRSLAKKYHPDHGGDSAKMADINAAWDNAKLARGWN